MQEQQRPSAFSDEITVLVDALDSHEWQFSESHERNDGYSTVEDGENDEIDAVRALMTKLRSRSRERLESTCVWSLHETVKRRRRAAAPRLHRARAAA